MRGGKNMTEEPIDNSIEKSEEQPAENVGNPIEQAEAAANRMEASNKKFEELLVRQEKMRANDILRGRASAGTPQPVATSEEDKKKAAAMEFFEGTDIAGAIEKHG